MSATTHWLATASAQSVLERGGNAFDAAVTAGFVLHVVEPHLNGAGGDLVGLIATGDGSAPRVLVGQGAAPRGATIEHYLAEGLTQVPGSGALAAAVPAAVSAWLWLLRTEGTWELEDVLEYAIGYAERGHAASAQLCAVISTMAAHFLEHWPTSATTWMPNGKPPVAGELITNPEYGATLRKLGKAAQDGDTRAERIAAAEREWSTGSLAHDLVSFAGMPHRHSTGGDHAGVISLEDLAELAITTEVPSTFEFRGVTVAKPGLWSQGPVLLQALSILDTFDSASLDPSTSLGIHTIVEALKLAMADRDAFYGDSPIAQSLLSELLSPEYARERASLIGERASLEFSPGRPGGLEPYSPVFSVPDPSDRSEGTGEPTVTISGETRGDTVHIDVVDQWGNIASITPSGGWLQSSPTIPGLGFCLGTRLQMSWLDATSPSALQPGRRPRTTLSPTMLLHDGKVTAALGTPGGDQQDQWQLLYLLRTIVGGYSPQQAIDAPMFHTPSIASSFWPRTFSPGEIIVENRLGHDVVHELETRGHRVTLSGPWSLGRISTVTIDRATGQLGAAANPRGMQGYAAGR
jgi:gamma-glutamyltranspeptidase/glutathione hydrolase